MTRMKTRVPYQGREVEGWAVDFTTVSENWNEYRLEDGSVVKLRIVPGSIVVTSEQNDAGDPVVVVASNILVQYVKSIEAQSGGKS